MFGLITGTVFSDIEVKESKAGKLYARCTLKDGFAEPNMYRQYVAQIYSRYLDLIYSM